jgi:hypothetical protein
MYIIYYNVLNAEHELVFDITTPTNAAACSGFGACSRPKIVFNQSTKKYVFYGFAGTVLTCS